MGKTIKIGTRLIGDGQPTYIIAEAGANHNGDLDLAKKLVVTAKEIGCDCIKFQTFTAEDFCADRTKTFTYKSQGKSVTESEFEMFKRLEFSRDQWRDLMGFCQSQDIFFMTTVQDPSNLKMMLDLGLQAIKVGSDDFDYIQNLRTYAETGLPLIVSKGMAELAEVDYILNELRHLNSNIAVLHCVSLYPSDPKFLNLNAIKTLNYLYPDFVWGFSDHSLGPVASTIAVSLGAKLIEKHFTLDHNLPGPDHWFSMDVAEMSQMVRDIRFCEQALGNGNIRVSEEERKSKKIMRRRVVAKRDLKPGDLLSEETVGFKRSELGEFISSWNMMKGARLRGPKETNQGIKLSDIEFS